MTRAANIEGLGVNEATRRRNPHLFGGIVATLAPVALHKTGKRLRQDPKPLMNALEMRLLAHLVGIYPGTTIRAQAKRYRLANGIWYKPDFTAIIGGIEHAWEAKGPKAFRGGFENLKFAAAQYPEVVWLLVWEDAGTWAKQKILP